MQPNISHRRCCCQLLYTEGKTDVISCQHVSCTCMSGQLQAYSGHENLTKFQVRQAHNLLLLLHAYMHVLPSTRLTKAGTRHLTHIRSAPYRLINPPRLRLIPANINPHSRHIYHSSLAWHGMPPQLPSPTWSLTKWLAVDTSVHSAHYLLTRRWTQLIKRQCSSGLALVHRCWKKIMYIRYANVLFCSSHVHHLKTHKADQNLQLKSVIICFSYIYIYVPTCSRCAEVQKCLFASRMQINFFHQNGCPRAAWKSWARVLAPPLISYQT